MSRKRIIKYINIEQVEYSAFSLAQQFMLWNEPIPDFSTRFPDILERCLSAPRQTYDKKDLYPTLEDKCSILFYVLIKDHPFQNGNKRLAVMSLLIFLAENNKWLKVSPKLLYQLAVLVAKSDPKEKELIIDFIRLFAKENITKS